VPVLPWKKRSRITDPPGAVTSRVVPTPKGRGEVHVTSLIIGPQAASDSSETSDSQTFSGEAANRFW